MGASRIEQLIEDIYEFIEGCRMQPLSSSKVIVPKDELYDLLDELRLRTPDEIKRYQKIISNRDAIIAEAEEKSTTMVAQAKEEVTQMMNEHEIMQQAYYQAQDIVDQAVAEAERILAGANADADAIRQGALEYTNDMLQGVENILNNAYDSTRSRFENILDTLKGNLDIVQNNLRELAPPEYIQHQEAAVSRAELPGDETQQLSSEEELDFDEDTFMQGIQP